MTTDHVREIRLIGRGHLLPAVAVFCACGWATPNIVAEDANYLVLAIVAAHELADRHLTKLYDHA